MKFPDVNAFAQICSLRVIDWEGTQTKRVTILTSGAVIVDLNPSHIISAKTAAHMVKLYRTGGSQAKSDGKD